MELPKSIDNCAVKGCESEQAFYPLPFVHELSILHHVCKECHKKFQIAFTKFTENIINKGFGDGRF